MHDYILISFLKKEFDDLESKSIAECVLLSIDEMNPFSDHDKEIIKTFGDFQHLNIPGKTGRFLSRLQLGKEKLEMEFIKTTDQQENEIVLIKQLPTLKSTSSFFQEGINKEGRESSTPTSNLNHAMRKQQ